MPSFLCACGGAARAALEDVGRIAARHGALELVDEVYRDAGAGPSSPLADRGDICITTSGLTKSYGLAALRCGWTVSSPPFAQRFRCARDVVDARDRSSPSGYTTALAERLLYDHDTAIVPDRFLEAPAHFRLGFGGATSDLPRDSKRWGVYLMLAAPRFSGTPEPRNPRNPGPSIP